MESGEGEEEVEKAVAQVVEAGAAERREAVFVAARSWGKSGGDADRWVAAPAGRAMHTISPL